MVLKLNNNIVLIVIIIFIIFFLFINYNNSCNLKINNFTNQKKILNLYNKPLESCSTNPMTGYGRDGYCKLLKGDVGSHTVCAIMTKDFLNFTKSKGNDLSTSKRNFPGLKEGDKWCLCALRWKEAYIAGKAPKVDFNATNKKTLKYININNLREHNMDIDLSNLTPDTTLQELEKDLTIYANKEKKKFTPVFKNPLNAKKISPTNGVHLSVPGLMPSSDSTWEDGTNTVYYMPNDKKPHLHGDAPHHEAMFEIDEVFKMSNRKYFPTKNKQIVEYRMKNGIINFNNGKSNTPVEVWIHWRIPYNKKEYPTLIVRKDSILWWDFTKHHNLFLLKKKIDYENNNFSNSIKVSKNKANSESETLVTFMDKIGIFYFVCTVEGHAKMGHKIIIKVI